MMLSPIQLPSSSSSMRSTYRPDLDWYAASRAQATTDYAPEWTMPPTPTNTQPVTKQRREPAVPAHTPTRARFEAPIAAPSAPRPLATPTPKPKADAASPFGNDEAIRLPRTLPSSAAVTTRPPSFALPQTPTAPSASLPMTSTASTPAPSAIPSSTRPRSTHHRRRSSASSIPSASTSTPLFVHANGTPMRVYVCPSLPRKISRAIERYGGAVVPISEALVHVAPHPPASAASDIDPDALVVSVRWVYAVVKKRAMADLKAFAVEYVPDWAAWGGSEACTPELE